MVTTQTPGVYVVEVPSGLAPIAGASTNTVGFIGFLTALPATVKIPIARKGYNPRNGSGEASKVNLKKADGTSKTQDEVVNELTGLILKDPQQITLTSVKTLQAGTGLTAAALKAVVDDLKKQASSDGKPVSLIKVIPKANLSELISGDILLSEVKSTTADTATDVDPPLFYGAGHKLDATDLTRVQALTSIKSVKVQRDFVIKPDTDSTDAKFTLDGWQLKDDYTFSPPAASLQIYLSNTRPLTADEAKAVFQAVQAAQSQDEIQISGNSPYEEILVQLAATFDTAKLCTNFSEFKQFLYGKNGLEQKDDQGNLLSLSGFPDPAKEPQLSHLMHAVYGFFSNGGTRCYVLLLNSSSFNSETSLSPFDAIEEISIVVAAGADKKTQDAIASYCEKGANAGNFYRFAISDSSDDSAITNPDVDKTKIPSRSPYAAFYYPWIQVADPASQIMKTNDGLLEVPPSGHVAGVYARVDNLRGVHKAPANEVIFGALGVTKPISKNQQAGLNPNGINCIRDLNGNIRIWGARTIGGEDNGEFMYVSTRRLFLYLRHSIDRATQWTVFEPNNPELWAKIRRNVTAFLTNTWRTGALFGTTPQEAFYVKCDAENNPPEVRDLGQVVIEIGVAVTKPAEFVIFRISQWAGPGA